MGIAKWIVGLKITCFSIFEKILPNYLHTLAVYEGAGSLYYYLRSLS